ncbi:TonB-dependent siderophore receptor, partial [Acinetobacter baumannii]
NSKRYGFAPTLTFGLGTDMRLTLAWLHQQADDIPDYGLPWLWGKPAPVRRENFYGFKGGDFLKTRADIGTATFAYDINKTFTLTNKLRY